MPADGSLDIADFARHDFPRYICLNCRALVHRFASTDDESVAGVCPTCAMQYYSNTPIRLLGRAGELHAYLAEYRHVLEFSNLFQHCRTLGSISLMYDRQEMTKDAHDRLPETDPLSVVLAAMQSAQRFVHFTTYGLDSFFEGVIRAVAFREGVSVLGIVSGVPRARREELERVMHMNIRLGLKLFGRGDWEAPHQKLVIVDGLFGIVGSANLTRNGYRNAASGREHFDCITDPARVVELNNTLFSPIWKWYETIGENAHRCSIDMSPWGNFCLGQFA